MNRGPLLAMAKSVAAGMKAVWEAAKKDFKENAHPDSLKQEVMDVFDAAKNKASQIKKSSSHPSYSVQSGKIGPQVNQDAGAELLTHFKNEWAEIHHSATAASQEATKVDLDLKQLDQSITKSHVIISRCREEFSHLKDVIEALDEAQSQVEAISELIGQVEKDIREYSSAKAGVNKERQCHSVQRQHEAAIAEDREKVELLRKVLLNEQQLSLNLKHDIESSKLRERQNAFQEIFDKQMAEYRSHGEVDKPIGQEVRERSLSAHLDDVVIEDEDGTASLHEFLSDVVLEGDTAGDTPNGSREIEDTPTESIESPDHDP